MRIGMIVVNSKIFQKFAGELNIEPGLVSVVYFVFLAELGARTTAEGRFSIQDGDGKAWF